MCKVEKGLGASVRITAETYKIKAINQEQEQQEQFYNILQDQDHKTQDSRPRPKLQNLFLRPRPRLCYWAK